MGNRLQEMQARNIKSLMIVGTALIVAWPIAWLLVPFGIVVGGALAAVGGFTIIRSFALRAELAKQQRGAPNA